MMNGETFQKQLKEMKEKRYLKACKTIRSGTPEKISKI